MIVQNKTPMGGRYGKRETSIKSFSSGVNTIVDSSVAGLGYAESAFNFDFNSGVLKHGYGMSNENLGIGFNYVYDRVVSSWLYRSPKGPRLMFCTLNGLNYWADAGGGTINYMDRFWLRSQPNAVNYRLYGEDVVIICSPVDGMFVWNGEGDPVAVEGAPKISSMAIHYERLFVTTTDNDSAVWFSDDLDPTNFYQDLEYGGFIEMPDERGKCLRVISFQNYLYVFREFGISRISAIGAQEEFSVTGLFVSSGRIYPDTVTVCGDLIMFLADDGLYSFNGVSATRVLGRLGALFSADENAVAAYCNGKYYLAFRGSFNDSRVIGCESGSYVNNALIVLDINDGSYCISRGMNITSLTAVPDYSRVCAITGEGKVGLIEKNGEFFGQPLVKCWSFGLSDMNAAGRKKILRYAYVNTRGDITLEVATEDGVKAVEVGGGKGVRRVRVDVGGELLGVDIVCREREAFVSKPKFEIDLV